jgi:transcriptional regulator GlxA family with amidase domain
MHTVVVVALPDSIAFDVFTPVEVFGRARLPRGVPAYRVQVCAPEPVVTAGPVRLAVDRGLEALAAADTIVVPGRENPLEPTPVAVLTALRDGAAAGKRIASICVGAFTLAEAGLLDGRRATTHWAAAADLQITHPQVEVDPRVLYVDTGPIVTSAGATAGVDMCLHLVQRDYGTAVAADASRLAVAPLHRDGGQAQFIVRNPPASAGADLTTLLTWMEENAHENLTLGELASRAGVSIRTLNRRFHDETGQTPMRWLTTARVRRAQELLETTEYDIDRLARHVGFASTTNFRAHFKKHTGVAPRAYRTTFRAGL